LNVEPLVVVIILFRGGPIKETTVYGGFTRGCSLQESRAYAFV
jgi:hypothetical protein